MSDTREILIQAREWLSNPDHWTRGIRENALGQTCAIGAINRACGVSNQDLPYVQPENREALSALGSVIDKYCSRMEEKIYHLNDEAGYECVMEAFDAAIEKLATEPDLG